MWLWQVVFLFHMCFLLWYSRFSIFLQFSDFSDEEQHFRLGILLQCATYLRLFSLKITQRLLLNIYNTAVCMFMLSHLQSKSHRKGVHQTHCVDASSIKSSVTMKDILLVFELICNSLISKPEPNGWQFKLTPVKTVNNIFQQLMSSHRNTHPPLWWPLIK